jgi:hypothetical protein
MDTYFYHQIIRKTVIGFGTLFNNIEVRHTDDNDNNVSAIRVPLSYAPAQKLLQRARQPDLNTKVQTSLPRMSFEMTGMSYDPSRKSGVTQSFKAISSSDGKSLRKVYLPVPYNLSFELNVLSKLNDDSLQILEQILPFFQPALNVTIDLVSSIGEKKDVPIVLESINQSDDYESDFNSRRTIIHTLRFTAKTHLFGPVAETADGLIKKVIVDYYQDTNVSTAQRAVRYTTTPRAIKDYNNDNTTTLNGEINDVIGKIVVSDASSLTVGTIIRIDEENMKINSVDQNVLQVTRGYDNTIRTLHLHDASIDVINSEDDLLIKPEDDFGFNDEKIFYDIGGNFTSI